MRGETTEALQQLRGAQLLPTQVNPRCRLFDEFDHLAFEPATSAEGISVLIEIAQMNRLTQAQTAAGDVASSRDQIQQRGLAAAVRTDDADAILWAEAVGEIPQQHRAVQAAVGGHHQLFRFDGELADPSAHTAHLQLGTTLFHRRFAHGLDALDPGLLLGAACLRALPEPGQSHHGA